MIKRIQHRVTGQVQGVGFRPFIYRLATTLGLTGEVKNTSRGVTIEVQGSLDSLAFFEKDLLSKLPPLAFIATHRMQEVSIRSDQEQFTINESTQEDIGVYGISISPDVSICQACLQEVKDKGRRKNYAFTNCTNCGPRYSITKALPYDRKNTSMSCFTLCEKCKAEYENPLDRRFHAQPNACPICGPTVWYAKDFRHTTSDEALAIGENAFHEVVKDIANGGIVAIKGLGGFHLVCDASNEKAVARLRKKKNRPHKPLAVMTDSLSSAQKFARVTDIAEMFILSEEHPITICPKLYHSEECFVPMPFCSHESPQGKEEIHIAPNVAPRIHSIGIMLPYTPLHEVLFDVYKEYLGPLCTPVLVMTSGNQGGSPIAISNREAVQKLANIADAWLFHNRDILIRVDDSIILPLEVPCAEKKSMPEAIFLRRARGYVPRSLIMPLPIYGKSEKKYLLEKKCEDQHDVPHIAEQAPTPIVLGVGAELKNTLCITRGSEAFISQHIGDMENVETEEFHKTISNHLTKILSVTPDMVVHDLHPHFATSRVARASSSLTKGLQHHAAHGFAVLGENQFTDRATVLTLDGTGFGSDGQLWGGEALVLDMKNGQWHRAGHLSPLYLPGGETAIREPWRIAYALLYQQGLHTNQTPWNEQYCATAQDLGLMIEKKLNTPLTSSCGRLFDGVSALLGVCLTTTYEGQAAILLEEAQWLDIPVLSRGNQSILPEEDVYPLTLLEKDGGFILHYASMITAMWEDILLGKVSTAQLSRKFHQSLAEGLCMLAEKVCHTYNVDHVGLSGGVMQNKTLLYLLHKGLQKRGLIPLAHKKLPPGDACISYGQALWGCISLLNT